MTLKVWVSSPFLESESIVVHSLIGANLEEANTNTHVCITTTASPLKEEKRAAVDVIVAFDVDVSKSV